MQSWHAQREPVRIPKPCSPPARSPLPSPEHERRETQMKNERNDGGCRKKCTRPSVRREMRCFFKPRTRTFARSERGAGAGRGGSILCVHAPLSFGVGTVLYYGGMYRLILPDSFLLHLYIQWPLPCCRCCCRC